MIDKNTYKENKPEINGLFDNLISYEKKDDRKCKTGINCFFKKIDTLKEIKCEEESVLTNKETLSLGENKNSVKTKQTKQNKVLSSSEISFIKKDCSYIKSILDEKLSSIPDLKIEVVEGFNSLPKKFDKIESNFDRVKDNIIIEIIEGFNNNPKLSNIEESVEVLPASITKISKKIDDLSTKLADIGSGKYLKNISDIPKDEKAIAELSKFMRDGFEQFENIATYYIQKQAELDQLDHERKQIDKKLSEAKKEAKKKAEIELAKKIFNNFPSEFEKINSVFEGVISSKYNKDEKINTSNEDIQKLEIYIEGIKEDKFSYKIITPDISISDEVIKRATVEVTAVKKSKTKK